MKSTVVVGVDFGTTYSSVYAHRSAQNADSKYDPEDPYSAFKLGKLIRIGRYPSAPPNSPPIDVPTVLLYYPRSKTIEWGWGVRPSLLNPAEVDYIKIEEFKLLLDKREFLRAEREGLLKTLHKIGWTPEEVIYTYLVRLLRHAKEQLTKWHFLSPDDSVQIVATVPAIWDGSADTIMADCLGRAATELEFGQHNEICLVSEPDAAATYHCQKELTDYPFLNEGDPFLICDNGGGTCDLILYLLDNADPPRTSEIVSGDGDTCGSAYVNRAYRRWLSAKLAAEEQYMPLDDPDTGGFGKVVEMAVPDFEMHVKRQFGEDDEAFVMLTVPIHHRVNQSVANHLYVERSVLEEFFKPLLARIMELIQDQLSRAKATGKICKKVIMAGGFSSSRYLQDYLEKALPEIRFKWPDPLERDNMIAAGAVMRYLNRLAGPKEILRAAYGFLRTEHYEPESFEGHTSGEAFTDKADGRKYVADCIAYFALKDHVSPPAGEVFDLDALNGGKMEWTIQDFSQNLRVTLDVVENRVAAPAENHFPKDHARNKGFLVIGQLEFIVSTEQLTAYKDALAIQLRERKERFGTLTAEDSGVEILSKRARSSRKQYFVLHSQVKFRKSCKNIQYELWVGGLRKAVGHLIPVSQIQTTELYTEFGSLKL